VKEKETPYQLCFDVLRRLSESSVLQGLVLIGSWCVYFYKQHYAKSPGAYSLRTTDMDFLIPIPPQVSPPADIQEVLAGMGFRRDFSSHGSMRLIHPELSIDFLVPWKGRDEGKPYLVKPFGINATPLRFVDLLLVRTITVNHEGITLRLPHPACFAFQKAIISGRRTNTEKRDKDSIQAQEALDMVIQQGDQVVAKKVFRSLPANWQKTILEGLQAGSPLPGSQVPEFIQELKLS